MKGLRIFVVFVAFAAGVVVDRYGPYVCDLIALAQLEEELSDVVWYEPDSMAPSFSEEQKRATVIVAVPDDMLGPDDRRNDEFARSFLVRGNEWRFIDPKNYKNANKWLGHTVRVYQPPKASPDDKKVVFAGE